MAIGPILRAMTHSKIRFGVIVLEIALTLAVGLNCATLIIKARRDMGRPSGFDDAQLIGVRSLPFEPAFKEKGYVERVRIDDQRVLSVVEGVEGVSDTNFLPWRGGGNSALLKPLDFPAKNLRTQIYSCDENLLRVLGTNLIAGQFFSHAQFEAELPRLDAIFAADRPVGADGRVLEPITQEVVISKQFARDAFDATEPLGRLFEDEQGDRYRVVGVVDKFMNPYAWPEINERAVFFMASASNGQRASWLVRAAPGQTAAVTTRLQKALENSNRGRNVKVDTIEEIKARYHGLSSLTSWLMSLLIALLVFVTALGIAGLTSFSVAERTRQIGTRRALGARRRDIIAYFLTETSLVTSLGIVIGMALAFGLNFALTALTGGTKIEVGPLVGAIIAIWLIGLISTYLPARRGAAIPPVIATRSI